jgi:hypothetical protein
MAAAWQQYLGITCAAIENGWMEGETFNNYFTRNFIRNVHPGRPCVLIYGGHNSHIGVLLVEKARKENIVISKNCKNTSYVMDFSVFWPLKLKWNEEIIKWQRKIIQRRYHNQSFHPQYRSSGRTSIQILFKMVSKAGISTLGTLLFKKLITKAVRF